jgi:hypothetical protein
LRDFDGEIDFFMLFLNVLMDAADSEMKNEALIIAKA